VPNNLCKLMLISPNGGLGYLVKILEVTGADTEFAAAVPLSTVN